MAKKIETAWQGRQGDVLLIQTNEKARTKNHVEVKREGGALVLQHGTVTGHSHAIRSPGVHLFAAEGEADRVLSVETTATLQHEEHGPIEIPAGIHLVRIQREWSGDDERQVQD